MSVHVISWVLRESRARLGERLVLICLADKAEDDGSNARPAQSTIARETRMARSAVAAALKALEAGGAIRRTGVHARAVVVYQVMMDARAAAYSSPPRTGPDVPSPVREQDTSPECDEGPRESPDRHGDLDDDDGRADSTGPDGGQVAEDRYLSGSGAHLSGIGARPVLLAGHNPSIDPSIEPSTTRPAGAGARDGAGGGGVDFPGDELVEEVASILRRSERLVVDDAGVRAALEAWPAADGRLAALTVLTWVSDPTFRHRNGAKLLGDALARLGSNPLTAARPASSAAAACPLEELAGCDRSALQRVWEPIAASLRDALGEDRFDIWLAGLHPHSLAGGMLVLGAPRGKAGWIRERFDRALGQALAAGDGATGVRVVECKPVMAGVGRAA